jgi:CMP-N-acetylneuraminic acid synthetase
MRHLAFIPARGGSKGVPGKNMRLLNGKPLLFYSFNWAKEIDIFDDIFISTDCPITLEYGISLGAKNTLLRNFSKALDKQTAIDLLISHHSNKSINLKDYDFIWYLQPTSPLRNQMMADLLISLIEKNKDLDSIVSFISVPKQYNAQWQFQINSEGYMHSNDFDLIPNRQTLPKRFVRDGRFYVTKTSYFLEARKLIGEKCIPIILDANLHVNIDTIEDWNKAKKICAEFFC